MIDLLLLVLLTVATAALSLVGGILLIISKKTAKFLQKYGPGIAAVIILLAVFGDILPEAVEEERLTIWEAVAWMLAGTVICLIIGFLLKRVHRHGDKRSLHNKKQAYGMLAVDSIHAVADGVVLGAAYAISPLTGVLTAVSTVAHEIPQEVGDFAIMLRSKIPTRRIILLQLLSSLLLVPAAVVAYILGDEVLAPHLPVVLALIGGFLLYIAMGELWVVYQDFRERGKN